MLSWNNTAGLFAKRTVETEYQEREERRSSIAKQREEHAKRKVMLHPGSSGGYLTVGVKIEGEEFPERLGVEEWREWIKLKSELFFQHAFVVGTTGAGKTELLIRLIAEALGNTRLRVYVIDGKGDLEFAEKIATLAYQHGRGPTPIFMMGQTTATQARSAIYDGFRGDREAIANRLSMMMAVDKSVGNAQHYTETYKGLMHLICGVGYPQLGITPPRDFDDVLNRLNFTWLTKTYRQYPRELETIKAARGVRENLIAAASSRLANLARPLEGAVGHKGFCLEESHCAIFSLRTQSVGADAKKFLEFLVEDVKDWVGKRQPPGVEALLVIDEFGMFSNESITDILTLARSSKVGVILAAQDVAQLGRNQVRRQILANCNTYFLMKTNFPEELVDLAGTIYAVEPSCQLENGMPTGMQSARIQHQFKIPPNDVAQLMPGQCYIINSRYATKLHVAKVEGIHIDPDAIAANPGAEDEAKETAQRAKDIKDKDTQAPHKQMMDEQEMDKQEPGQRQKDKQAPNKKEKAKRGKDKQETGTQAANTAKLDPVQPDENDDFLDIPE